MVCRRKYSVPHFAFWPIPIMDSPAPLSGAFYDALWPFSGVFPPFYVPNVIRLPSARESGYVRSGQGRSSDKQKGSIGMKVQFEWQAGDDRGRWETIAESKRRKTLPWWGWVLVVLGGLAAVALVYSGYIALS